MSKTFKVIAIPLIIVLVYFLITSRTNWEAYNFGWGYLALIIIFIVCFLVCLALIKDKKR